MESSYCNLEVPSPKLAVRPLPISRSKAPEVVSEGPGKSGAGMAN